MTPYLSPPKPCKCNFCRRAKSYDSWFEDGSTTRYYKRIIKDYESRFQRLSFGHSRVVFEHKGFVIKVPRSAYGRRCNLVEHRLWKKYGKKGKRDGTKYARCRMMGSILIMERVACARSKPDFWGTRPSWVMSIDNSQVGYDIKKRLVAYDYGGFPR